MINFTYEEVSSLKVPILREELRNIGLSSQGLKAELIEGVWSHYEEQRNLQDRPDREVSTPNLLPNAIEIGETTDQNGYIWNNQCTMKDELDRLSLNDEGSAQVKDDIIESSSEIDEQDRNLVQKKLHRVKNLFRFILGTVEYRDPGKLVEDIECVRDEAASIYVSHPQDIQVLRILKLHIELDLVLAKDKFKHREALEQSMVTGRSFSSNEFKTKMDTNTRCISRVTNVCYDINNILKINIENMSLTQFLGYVAYEEERVKELNEVFSAAADDYTNCDLDEPVTNSIILDTDRKLILWRRKLDKVKKKHFLHLNTEDNLMKKVDHSPFTRDVTDQLGDATLNSTEEVNLLSNNYLPEKENHPKPEIPQTERDLLSYMKQSRKLFTRKLINTEMKSQQQTFSGVIIIVDSPQLHHTFRSCETISKEYLSFQHDPHSGQPSGQQIPAVNIPKILGSKFHMKLDNSKVGIQMLFLLLYDKVADKTSTSEYVSADW